MQQFIQIIGNLGADPETRFTANGQKVVSLRIACNRKKAGADHTTWYRATLWAETATKYEKMLSFLKKGSSIVLMGDLRAELYEGKLSLQVDVAYMGFLPRSPSAGSKGGEEGRENAGPKEPFQPFPEGASAGFLDEEVPF